MLEGLAGLAARAGHMRVRTGPKDPALRRARICYDHLAGDLGVQMLDSLKKQKLVRQSKQAIELTAEGERFMASALQIDAGTLAHPRRPLCKACLDWSERRHHLAGTLGAAIMARFTELNWAAARRLARQPRRQFYPQRREAICGAVRRRHGLIAGLIDPPPLGAHSFRVQVATLKSHKCFDCCNRSAYRIEPANRSGAAAMRPALEGEDMKYLIAAALLATTVAGFAPAPMPPADAAPAITAAPMADAFSL